ncbi:MAG: hypothetical protein IIC94_08880 [Chloroflexi bacterium]|nr:hypothetical protein [Chloroflexota bacterium]
MNRRTLPVILLTLTALLLAGTMSAAAAPPAQDAGARRAVFGEVVANDSGVLTVRTKDGDVTVTVTGETAVRGRGGDEEGAGEIAVGDRVAIVSVEGTARSVLVTSAQRKERARVVHLSGVVSEITEDGAIFVSEDGTERKVAFGLNAAPPEPGTVVTLTGRIDAGSGTLQVRSVHPLRKTIERLNGHIDELDQGSGDRSGRLLRLKRVQELLERNAGRQVQLLTRVAEKLPEAAQAGLARAIEGLEEANRGVARAFERALKLAGEAEWERRNVDDLRPSRLPQEAKPTFEDVAAVLGITTEELSALLIEPLQPIIEFLGMKPSELHDGIVARVEERLKNVIERRDLTISLNVIERRDLTISMELILDQVRDGIAARIRSLFHDSPIHDELPFTVEDLATVFGFGPEGTFAAGTFARLREGATPFELAEERGISRDELIEKLRALTEERARSLVEEGALAREDLDRSMARFAEDLRERLSESKVRRAPDRDEDEASKKEREREEDARKVPFDLKVLAELFGTDPESVRKLLVDGRTLAEVAAQHGATVEAMADRLLAEMKRKLRRQIENGDITDGEATQLLDRARSSYIERLRAFRVKDRGGPTTGQATGIRVHRPYAGVALTVDEIADAIGVSADELRALTAERGGVAKLLEARGVSAEDVVAKLLRLVEPRLDTRADAGERAGKQLSDLKRRLLEDLGGGTRRVEPARRAVDVAAPTAALGFIPFDVQTVARVLGIAPQRLRELLRERTVAEIAERAGVPLRSILDALMAPLEKRVQAAAAEGTPTERLREKIAAAREDLLQALRRFKLPERDVRPRLTDEAPPRLTDVTVRPRPTTPPTATPAPADTAVRVSIAAGVASACGLTTRDWDVSLAAEWKTLRTALIKCQNDLLASLRDGLADVNKRAAAVRAEALDATGRESDAPSLSEIDEGRVADEVPGDLIDALDDALGSHSAVVDVPVTTDDEARADRLLGRFEALSARIATLETRLSALRDDAQLTDIGLQNAIQQQSRTLQTLSNILKATHDSAMNAMRNTRA